MVKIPFFPSYIQTQLLIKCLNDKKESEYKSLWNDVWNLRGIPQEPVDWQNPDQWIPERFSGTNQDFALIFRKKNNSQIVNAPRRIYARAGNLKSKCFFYLC
jgi:restriction system protein